MQHPSLRRRRRRPLATRTLWSLAVLGMLRERPMHPYEMQRVMHQRHTDELLALKRGSLYHAINQLQRDGLIEPIETSREGRRPERTVYQLTPDGEDELLIWLRDLISVPTHDPSHFTAALAFVRHIEPADALEQLELRALSLAASIAAARAIERAVGEQVGRASVLEVEYQRSLQEADLAWVRALIADIRSQKLTWNLEELNVDFPSDSIHINNPEEHAR